MWNNEKGEFVRYKSNFRDWIKKDGSARFQPEGGRYHLYISWACPWASRAVIMRGLKKLENVISLSVVDPVWDEKGWKFCEGPGNIEDFVNHKKSLVDIYRLADPKFNGEESVPVLWDKKLNTIVNNESREIMRMFDIEFNDLAGDKTIFAPEEEIEQVDVVIDELYPNVNNGVYRAGFATSQRAYELAVCVLFEALDRWEKVLSQSRYLLGNQLTEADVCLFTTLFRFEIVYYSHFKCNIRRLRDYPNLWNFTKDIYQTPGIAALCNIDHCKRHYYMSQTSINPNRVVPVGPTIDYTEPHDRNRFS
jgi:glutathionyl-hydroquinone reductase